jgi:DNA-binding NarL/FixJ family response regulator
LGATAPDSRRREPSKPLPANRGQSRLPYAGTLEGTLTTYVATLDTVAAAVIVKALEREGLNVDASSGPLSDVPGGQVSRVDVLVVVEPAGAIIDESEYERVRAAMPDAAIVVVASVGRDRPQSLLWAGADAILFEPGADALVGPAVRMLVADYVVVPRTLRAGVSPPPLTRRERQMLELVVEGLTNREIAQRLYLAESTVKRHLSSTFRRLGVRSRSEAASAVLAAERSFGVGRPSPPNGS